MSFELGSLVRARGREWVVLPGSEPELLMLRPLGGTDDEVTGVDTVLEPVTPVSFAPPDPTRDLGDHRACATLRDAVRLGFRAGAGPFRSLARIGVEPRPYQLVPLLMALRQKTVRLLIADDVGIGKTIEACLIARELLDRAEIERVAVLCPPHLAEGWRRALREQFHLDAVAVLAGTASRLERDLGHGQSLFERHPFVVVSMDYIKGEQRRHTFLRTCPELVIVDEAHGCADVNGSRGAQQRHQLLTQLARDPNRHIVLVTATPHSGDDRGFRSLLALLDPRLASLPEDLSGDAREKDRELLAEFLVQRRRADLRAYLKTDTPFPERDVAEDWYQLTPAYREVLRKVLDWCRERIYDDALDRRRQRVRWWAALALLRALSSSPRAAVATLRTRAAGVEDDDDPDERGRRAVFDQDDDSAEGSDAPPGGDAESEGQSPERKRLLALAREVEALEGAKDAKLAKAVELVQSILRDGFNLVVFCRFIPTVAYLAEALRKRLKDVHV